LDIEKIEKLFIFFVKNVSDAACWMYLHID
jgi:hypothetical protein